MQLTACMVNVCGQCANMRIPLVGKPASQPRLLGSGVQQAPGRRGGRPSPFRPPPLLGMMADCREPIFQPPPTNDHPFCLSPLALLFPHHVPSYYCTDVHYYYTLRTTVQYDSQQPGETWSDALLPLCTVHTHYKVVRPNMRHTYCREADKPY